MYNVVSDDTGPQVGPFSPRHGASSGCRWRRIYN